MKGMVEYRRREGRAAWSDADEGRRWILTWTRNVANYVWSAGKRLTLFTLVLGLIPILLPVFIFSLFAGLLFAAPLLCGIGAYVLFFHVLYPSTSLPGDHVPTSLRSAQLQFYEKPIVHEGGDNSQGRTLRDSYGDSNDESSSLLDAVLCVPLSDDGKAQKEVQEVVDISPRYQGSETGNDGLEVSRSKEVSDNGHNDEGVTSPATSGTFGGLTEKTADAFHTALCAGAEGDSEELLESNGSTNSCLEQGWPLPLRQKKPEDFRRVEEEAEAATTFSRFSFPAPSDEVVVEEAAAAEFPVSTPRSKLEEKPEEVLVGEEAAGAESLVGTPPSKLDERPEEVLKKEAALAESLVGIASSKLEERPWEAQIPTDLSDVRSSSNGKDIDEMPKMEEESEKYSMIRKMPGTVPHEEEIPVQSLWVTIPQSEYAIPRHLNGILNGEERGNKEWIPKAPSNIASSLERNNDEGYAPISPLSMYEAPRPHHRFKEFRKGYKEWPERRSDIITSRSSEFPPGSTTSIESIDVFSGEFEGLLSYWREKDKGKLLPAYPPSTAEVACHLRSEITVIKRILGEEFAPQYSIWKDVEKLSEIVGVQLPDMGDVSDLTKARIGLDLLRVVVGVKDIDDAPTSSI